MEQRVDWTSMRYRSRLRELAGERQRFGYRRLYWLMKRGGDHEPQEAPPPRRYGLGSLIWPDDLANFK